MKESPYTNRELDDHFNDVKTVLARIECQTTKTNGRVNKLEAWRSLLVGAWFVAYCMVIPLLAYLYTNQMNYFKEIINQNTSAIHEINEHLQEL